MNLLDMFNINDLYTIKLFLAQWDSDFDSDVAKIAQLKARGCKRNVPLYKALVIRFEPLLPTKRVLDGVSKKGSFKLYIDYLYKHDELHQHFAYYYQPLYKRILKRPDTIYTSSEKFKELSKEDQFKCALEEIYTVATERLIIPWGYSLQEAKAIALKRLCIGLSKGYFCIYLLEHFFELLYSNNSYFDKKLKDLGEY
jgi:hypothetical protein